MKTRISKTLRKQLSIAAVIFTASMLSASSCSNNSVRMHTTVNSDGSSVREISYSNVLPQTYRDSVAEAKEEWLLNHIPAHVDTAIFKRTEVTFITSDSVITTYRKEFSSVDQIGEELPMKLNETRHLKSHASLTKRFKWFYTEYTFTEVFESISDEFRHSVYEFLPKDEVEYWFTGQPNLVQGMNGAEAADKTALIGKAVQMWLYYNCLCKYVEELALPQNYEKMAEPPVSRERFIELQDSLCKYIVSSAEELDKIDLKKCFREFFQSDAFSSQIDEDWKLSIIAQLMYGEMLELSVPYTLTMPGKIVDAGMGSCQSDTIHYPLTGERLVPHNYTITATSRVTNVWAYIVAILIVGIAIGSFVWKR